jgi:hypothetical protein
MRQMWTDDELDQALAELHADVRPTPDGLAITRERVLSGEPVRSRRFHRAWLPIVAAAAAAALVSTVLVLLPHTAQPAAPPPPKPLPTPVPVSVDWVLNNITYSDPKIAPGQFRYVRDQQWAGGASGNPSKPLTDQATTTWQPAKWTDQWLRRDSVLGSLTVTDENGQVVAAGPEQKFSKPSNDVRAGCADFDAVAPQNSGGRLPCVDQKGSWLTPTPDWLASLPKGAVALADKLKAETPNDVSPLYLAVQALKTGVVPADIRPILYRALTYLPGDAFGTKDVANLDGKLGFAIGVVKQGVVDEILIDPDDGTYLGERQYEPDNSSILLISAMRYGVVDKLGVTP